MRGIEYSRRECCRDDDGALVDLDGVIGECRFEGYPGRIDNALRNRPANATLVAIR
jgi:hypothetical protein